jgi:hypothetical protein
MSNPEVLMTLDDAVDEVLGMLTGLDLTYDPEQDRYRSITRQLNRALRANALENEWSHYASVTPVGTAQEGQSRLLMHATMRPRIINDDAVRLVNDDGVIVKWAYFLPRDALHKYQSREGLWCSVERQALVFSRPFTDAEDGLQIQVPVMREPRMFRLPEAGETVPAGIREQEIDFAYPDVVIARAAFYYAQSDPVMQPRVPTLEDGYKNLMYSLIERDTQYTDSPYINETIIPVQNGLYGEDVMGHLHPHANSD